MSVARCDIRVDVSDVGLVDAAVAKASLIGALVDNHGILHVVTRVRDHSHYGIGPTRAHIEIIVQVLVRAHQRLLREQKSVDLVVHSVGVVVIWRAHGLLGHLTLVHVARRLVVVTEGDG